MSYLTNAQTLRAAMDNAAAVLTDEQALTAKALYPTWESLIGTAATPGQRFRYGEALYKVLQAHTFSSEWIPGTETASLYEVIDETHSGTMDDPIPWIPPMTLENGKYYTQNSKLYECWRDSGTALAYDLADLVGTYVTEITE